MPGAVKAKLCALTIMGSRPTGKWLRLLRRWIALSGTSLSIACFSCRFNFTAVNRAEDEVRNGPGYVEVVGVHQPMRVVNSMMLAQATDNRQSSNPGVFAEVITEMQRFILQEVEHSHNHE